LPVNSVSLTDRCPTLSSDGASFARSREDELGSFDEVHPTTTEASPSATESLKEHLRDDHPASSAEHESLASGQQKQVMDTSFVSCLVALLVPAIITTVLTARFGEK